MNKRRKEFLEGILDYCDYWKDREDGIYGLAFSILVMIDGCSSANDFQPITLVGISNGDELHEEFCELRRKRNEKV